MFTTREQLALCAVAFMVHIITCVIGSELERRARDVIHGCGSSIHICGMHHGRRRLVGVYLLDFFFVDVWCRNVRHARKVLK